MEEVGFTVDNSDIYEDHRVTVDRKMKSGGIKDVTFWLARLTQTPVLSHDQRSYHWLNGGESSERHGPYGASSEMF